MSRVFISYSRKDEEFAKQLYTRLSTDGVDCFIDQEALTPGENVVERLAAELSACEVFLPIISPDFQASIWTSRELTAALARTSSSSPLMILPILLRPTSPLPVFISALQMLDMSNGNIFESKYGELCRTLGAVPSDANPANTIARRFGLRRVILAEASSEADLTAALGKATAEYFLENIPERSRVALSCANTVFQFARALPPFVRKLFLYPVSYNVDPEMLSVRSPYSTLLEISNRNPQAIAHSIPLPAFFLSDEERALVRGRSDIGELLAEAYDPNAAFYSVGDLGPGSSYDVATPYIRKYIKPTFRRQELIDAGAVAEINLFPFASDGTPIPHRLATLCACLDLTRIRALSRDHQRDMVLIAGGRRKTSAILAALNGRYLNVLITDTHSACEILAASSPRVP